MKTLHLQRREAFFEKLQKHAGTNAVAVVPAHPILYRNGNRSFKFRQDSNFYYLTGFEEPDAIAVFRTVGGRKEYILFVPPKDLSKEIWDGYRCGVDNAVSEYGAHRAYTIDEFDKMMPEILKGTERFYYAFFQTLHRNGVEFLDQKILRYLNEHRVSFGRSGRGLTPLFDANEVLGEMRLFKSAEEIENMRKAASISARAHTEVMARARPGLYEYQIEALIEYIFRNEGADGIAYNSIIASGENATILHHVENRRKIEEGDLVLIDAGCEYHYYASDITRTFPITSKIKPEQKQIYDIVLDVQKQCLSLAKPGATLAGIHQFAVEELTKAMVSLKFLSGDVKKLIETLAYKRYYPHGTGHLLGMDVHDCGLYQIGGEPRKLEPGMCFTVEPGFYILRDDQAAPQKYRGIGVRIEDDVFITQSGHEVLTTGVTKELSEICNLVGTKSWINI